MQPISKKPLTFLAIMSIIFSRVMFVFFDDPEGPNLLVVFVMSAFVYVVTLAGYFIIFKKQSGMKKILWTILFQIFVVLSLYICLK
jgi:hypothetical protein